MRNIDGVLATIGRSCGKLAALEAARGFTRDEILDRALAGYAHTLLKADVEKGSPHVD